MESPTSTEIVGHSPGPWRLSESSGDLELLAADGKVIAYFGDIQTASATDLQDAALITVAPELLDIVHQALLIMRPGTMLHKRTVETLVKAKDRIQL